MVFLVQSSTVARELQTLPVHLRDEADAERNPHKAVVRIQEVSRAPDVWPRLERGEDASIGFDMWMKPVANRRHQVQQSFGLRLEKTGTSRR